MKKVIVFIFFAVTITAFGQSADINLTQEMVAPNHTLGKLPPHSCPPLVIPVIGYATQPGLKSGINTELNLYFPSGKCSDCTGFGVLCYFIGWSTGLHVQYFPAVKVVDIAANVGYRNANIIPLAKIQLGAGYALANNTSPYKSFFHLDPGFGFDLFLVHIIAGYSIRSEEIQDKRGGVFFQASISPLLFAKSKSKQTMSVFFNTPKAERIKYFQNNF